MGQPKKKSNSTELLLGQVIGELNGLKEIVHAEFKTMKDTIATQNGSLGRVKQCVSQLSVKVNDLPCKERAAEIENLATIINKEEEEEAGKEKEKRVGRRDLKVALIAALITGVFTVAGVVIAIAMTA